MSDWAVAGRLFNSIKVLKIAFHLDALPGFFLNQLFGQILDSQAAGAMAGFTIHQGHAGFLLQLSTHGAGVKRNSCSRSCS